MRLFANGKFENGMTVVGSVELDVDGDVHVKLIITKIPNVGGVVLNLTIMGPMDEMTIGDGVILLEGTDPVCYGSSMFTVTESQGIGTVESNVTGDLAAQQILSGLLDQMFGPAKSADMVEVMIALHPLTRDPFGDYDLNDGDANPASDEEWQ